MGKLRPGWALRALRLGVVLASVNGARMEASPVLISEWIGGSGGAWASPAHWSAGVPLNSSVSSYHARVTAGLAVVDTAARVDQLTIGPSGALDVGTSGRLELSTANLAANPDAGLALADGPLRVLAGGTLAFDTSGGHAYLSLGSDATVAAGGRIEKAGAGTLVIESVNGSVLRLGGPGAEIAGVGFVQNNAEIVGSGAIRAAFANAGRTLAEGGTLLLETGPGSLIYNAFILGAEAGSTLVIDGSGGGTFLNADTVTVAPGSVVELRSFGTGGGTFEGDGFFDVSGTLRLAADLPEARIETFGFVRLDSGVVEFAGTAAHTLAGATVLLSNSAANEIRGATGTERIALDVAASGAGRVHGFAELTNNGLLHAEGASGLVIETGSGWFLNNGTLSTAQGSFLRIDNAAGWRNFDAATGTLEGGQYEVTDNSVLEFTGGAAITQMRDARVRLKGAGALFTHDGVSQALDGLQGMERGGLYLEGGAALATGPLRLVDATLRVEAGSSLDAAGLVTLDGGEVWISRTGVMRADEFIQHAGETVVNGTMRADVTVEGGRYEGAGTTDGDLQVDRDGTFDVDGKHTVTGDARLAGLLVLTIAGYTRGVAYDWLDIGGTAQLGGTLHVVLGPEFDTATLSHGRAFVLVTFAGRSGTFATVILPEIEMFDWRTVYTGTSLVLEAVNPLIRHEVPEPGTVGLSVAGVVILAMLGRRWRGPWENGGSPGRRSSPDARTNHRARRTAA